MKKKSNGIIGQISRIREQANLFIEQELHELDIEGILPAHGSILRFLFEQNQPVPIKSVVEKVGRVKSTVTGMIKTLENHGYVTKYQSPEDGRVMLVHLTEKGQTLKEPMVAISIRLMEKVYGDIPEEDRDILTGYLSRILFNLCN